MIVWFVLLVVTSCVCSKSIDTSTLELVHVIFRHGSRTAEEFEFYPKDTYTVKDFFPQEYGQLTIKGKQQAYQLGTILRERYSTILNETYTSDLIFTKTTNYDRTKMTALLVLAALLPPTPSTEWNSNINWQPIPYHHDKHDHVLTIPRTYCPVYNRELNKEMTSDVYQNIMANYSSTFEYLTNHTGQEKKELLDVLFLFHILNTEENMNLTLPDWAKLVYPQTIREISNLRLYFESKTMLLKRLHGGRILKVMIKNMVGKSLGKLNPPGRKMYLYSAHDTDVASVLAVLNTFTPHIPDYCSAVAIELHRSNTSNEYYVKAIYIKNAYAEPEELLLPDCGILCPLETFLQLTSQYIPGNYTEECESDVSLE